MFNGWDGEGIIDRHPQRIAKLLPPPMPPQTPLHVKSREAASFNQALQRTTIVALFAIVARRLVVSELERSAE